MNIVHYERAQTESIHFWVFSKHLIRVRKVQQHSVKYIRRPTYGRSQISAGQHNQNVGNSKQKLNARK